MIMDELKQRHGCVTFWLWLVIDHVIDSFKVFK